MHFIRGNRGVMITTKVTEYADNMILISYTIHCHCKLLRDIKKVRQGVAILYRYCYLVEPEVLQIHSFVDLKSNI